MRRRDRARQNRDLIALRFASLVREKYPSLPEGEEHVIARYSLAPFTDRVGALSSGDGWIAEAAELATVAHARHRFTRYEALLDAGAERDEARAAVRDDVTRVLKRWCARGDATAR